MKTPFKPDRSIFSLAPSKPQKPQARTKFDYKLSCSLRLQLSLKKLILLHIENLTVEMHVLFALNMSNFLLIRCYLLYNL